MPGKFKRISAHESDSNFDSTHPGNVIRWILISLACVFATSGAILIAVLLGLFENRQLCDSCDSIKSVYLGCQQTTLALEDAIGGDVGSCITVCQQEFCVGPFELDSDCECSGSALIPSTCPSYATCVLQCTGSCGNITSNEPTCSEETTLCVYPDLMCMTMNYTGNAATICPS